MAWLESHQELRNHPKIMRAARALSISRAAMIGHMHCLWWWALDYAQDGNLGDFTADDIAQAAEWEGDPDTFVLALAEAAKIGTKAGLLEYHDGALCIHDWWDYAGKLIDKRQADAQRKRDERRWDNAKTAQDIPQASNGHPVDIPRMSQAQYSTVPNRTEQNQTEPDRPETRAEPEKSETSKPFVATPPAPSPLPVKAVEAEITPAPKLPSAQQEMFGALEATCSLNGEVKSVAARIGKAASELIAAKHTPEQVRAFTTWWLADAWRAEHTPTPTLPQVVEKLKQSLAPPNRSNGKDHGPAVKESSSQTAIRMQMEINERCERERAGSPN